MGSRLSNVLAVLVLLVLTGTTLARNHVWRDEIRLWTDTLSKSPDKPRAWHALGLAHRRLGEQCEAQLKTPADWQQCSSHFEQAFLIAKTATQRLPNPDHEFYQQMGADLISLRRFTEAQGVYLELAQRINTTQAWSNLAGSFFREWLQRKEGKLNIERDPLLFAANEAYSQVIQRDASDIFAIDGWADTKYYSGDYLAEMNYLLTVDRPLHASEVYVLGKWSINAGDHATGARMLHAANLKSMSAYALYWEGVAWYESGQLPESIEALTKALRREPTFAAARYNLALAYRAQGRLDLAEKHLKDAGIRPMS